MGKGAGPLVININHEKPRGGCWSNPDKQAMVSIYAALNRGLTSNYETRASMALRNF